MIYSWLTDRFKDTSILVMRTHYKPTETFQGTHFSSTHPQGIRKGSQKATATSERLSRYFGKYRGDALRRATRKEKSVLQQRGKEYTKVLPFVKQYQPAQPNLKKASLDE